MPYSNNPATNPVDRVRLKTGDVFQDFEILDDTTYQYFLDSNNGNETAAAMAAARLIRIQIARFPTRETTGDIEVWSDFAKLYTAALDDLINDVGGSSFVAIPYAGGISQRDMLQNNMNWDRVALNLPKLTTCPYRHWIWTDSQHPLVVEAWDDL